MRKRVSELGHSHNYGLQDGGRCVEAIVETTVGVVFVLIKAFVLENDKHFVVVFLVFISSAV